MINKSIYNALKYVYVIGNSKSFLICKKLGFLSSLKVKNLSSTQIVQILKLVESLNFLVAIELKRFTLLRTQLLINIKSYCGLKRKEGFLVKRHCNTRLCKNSKKRL